jgi:DNA-binding LacI/PurR family transcriptional regulator
MRKPETSGGDGRNRARESRHPTEIDVAELAGVSQSAVSRAFTAGASIATETRARILEAAKAIGYQPNLIARSLSTKRSNIVGLAISSLENPFYAQVVKELSERLSATGRYILMFAASSGEEADPRLEAFLSYQIDALVLTATSPSEALVAHCRKSGVPVVLINRETKVAGVSTVRGENRRAGETVGAFLIAAGHRRFAFIGGTAVSTVSRERETAFSEYVGGRGHAVAVRYGDYTFTGAAAAARALLSLPDRPDAIFCASDFMAFATLEVARREFDLSIPGDLSVVGVDDVAEASHAAYDLTTFSQHPAELARETIAIIDAHIASKRPRTERREVHGELIVRSSARVPETGVSEAGGRRIWGSVRH